MISGVLITFFVYLIALFLITRFLGGRDRSNNGFFIAGRATPWWVVAVGMLGDSISGVTFVSVPGMVGVADMTYMQLVLGFFLGYLVIAYVLLPLYYRLRLVSIYTYLEQRFGLYTYRTGASFFILSKTFGAAAKLYLISLILQTLVFAPLGVPYPLTVIALVGIIWLYTQYGGMGTIIWTDVLQTSCLVLTLVLIIWQVASQMGWSFADIIQIVQSSPHHRLFVLAPATHPQFFLKQILNGIFIVIVMTGLDQNMMQKNLSCRTLPEARKNMLTYGFGFLPLNYLFLVLGILLLAYAQTKGISLPEKGDEILPFLASQHLGGVVLVCFTLGITAASFSNADSALTSLTTSVCIDLLGMKDGGNSSDEQTQKDERTRRWVHLLICLAFVGMVLFIGSLQQSSVLNTIFVAVSYTYGPLLGLFAFGMFTRLEVRDKLTPYVCILSPLLCYGVEWLLKYYFDYKVGYEILLLNGLLTALFLWVIALPKRDKRVLAQTL